MERQLSLCINSHKTVDINPDDLKNEEFVIECLHQKCLDYLNCHHEFRQLSKERKHYSQIYHSFQVNITKAKAFIMAYLEQCQDVQDQISWLFGTDFPEIKSKITFTKYSNRFMLKLKQWLQSFPFMNSCVNTILLVILWSTDLIAKDSISLESHLAAMRDRYEAYLVHIIKSQPDAKKCISLLLELLNQQ